MRSLTMATLGTLFAVTAAQAQMIVTRGGPGGGGSSRMNIGGSQPVFEEGPAEYGVTGWHVGDWVRYSIAINMGQMPITQARQISIVGQEGGKFWVETQDEFVGAMSSRWARVGCSLAWLWGSLLDSRTVPCSVFSSYSRQACSCLGTCCASGSVDVTPN